MRAPSEFTEAIVLRSVDYGDADRIITLLTSRFGKVSAMARGARRSTKRFQALSPFCVLRVELSLGRGEMGTLRGAELTRPFPSILGSLDKLSVAGAACELVREVTPMREPDAAIFATSIAFFGALDVAEEHLHGLLQGFCLRVMGLAGFAPGLEACGVCGRAPRTTQAGTFDAGLGALCCRQCGGRGVKLAGTTLMAMRRALGAEWFSAFDQMVPSEMRRVQRVTRDFIEQRLERPLHGAAMLTQVDSETES